MNLRNCISTWSRAAPYLASPAVRSSTSARPTTLDAFSTSRDRASPYWQEQFSSHSLVVSSTNGLASAEGGPGGADGRPPQLLHVEDVGGAEGEGPVVGVVEGLRRRLLLVPQRLRQPDPVRLQQSASQARRQSEWEP